MKIPATVSLSSIAIGAGIVLLAPIAIPVIAGITKPIIKAAIKGGLMAYEGVKVSIAEAKESLEDLAAEAKAEIAKESE